MKAAATAVVLGIAAVVAVGSSGRPERAAPSPSALGTATPPPVPAVSASPEQAAAATGAVALLASAARAQAVVAGVVSGVAKVDVHGWRAALRVDNVLFGDVLLGDTVTIAWEELSTSRRVRFADGERLLVVLDPLPTQSLWRKRFPPGDRAQTVLVVASGGDAFLRHPDGPTLHALEHYLALTPSARGGTPGVRWLAELVNGGDPSLAREVLASFDADPARVDLLGDDGGAALLAAARRPDREPALRAAALRLAASHDVPETRETALALTAPESPIRAAAYRALARFPGALSAERVETLLGEADPELRVVGVEVGRDLGRDRLRALVRSDPAPTVRLTAGRTLLARGGEAAIADVTALLDDADAGVRNGIAEGIGALGPQAVPALRAVVDGDSERAAVAAIVGLARAGKPGAEAIVAIARSHPKPPVRAFARLALGEAPGHTH